jgi:hypothetical protein
MSHKVDDMEWVKLELDARWNVPDVRAPLPHIRNQLLSGISWDRIVEERFRFGSPMSFLQNDLSYVHKFTFDEIMLLEPLLNLGGIDSLKALYKTEIISRLRIWKLLSMVIRCGFHRYVNKARERGVNLLGVFWGSTGRFEASETSDYEFLFIRQETDSTTTYLKRDLNEKLAEVSEKLIGELASTPEFRSAHPCGTITDYGLKRSWRYMMKHKRPMLVAYLFSYCFFQDPMKLHSVLKTECLKHFGLREIILRRTKLLGTRRFRALLGKPLDAPIGVSTKTLKDCGMDTIQSLALLKLKEEAGHSLIDDVLKMRTRGILNDNETLEIVRSVLEIYKARVERDKGKETIITTPRKLSGFKLAFELLDRDLQ